jgi:gluconolactonase
MTGRIVLTLGVLLVAATPSAAQVTGDVPAARPDAIVNLATREGARLVKGEWRYSDTTIVEVEHPLSFAGGTRELRRDLAEAQAEAGRAAGPDMKPTGAPTKAYDIQPQAGAADFDDRSWQVLDPETLDTRRSKGRLAFNWYRINITIPEKVASFETKDSTVVFEVVVDDYVIPTNKMGLISVSGQAHFLCAWHICGKFPAGRGVSRGPCPTVFRESGWRQA